MKKGLEVLVAPLIFLSSLSGCASIGQDVGKGIVKQATIRQIPGTVKDEADREAIKISIINQMRNDWITVRQVDHAYSIGDRELLFAMYLILRNQDAYPLTATRILNDLKNSGYEFPDTKAMIDKIEKEWGYKKGFTPYFSQAILNVDFNKEQ